MMGKMAPAMNRFSTYTTTSAGSGSKDEDGKKDMWSSMLDSVASGKRLPQKNLLVMGGSVESQRDLIEVLSNSAGRRNNDRGDRMPPIANQFALGYTYYDLLDADQEDTLARISAYLLSSSSPAFAPLVSPLLTPTSVPNTFLVLLLDWAEPWLWLRQLREWMLFLRTVLMSSPDDSKATMEEVMSSWKDRGRGGGVNLDGTTAVTGTTSTAENDVALPLGPGEWEDALGLPLCVVCQNSEKMEILERTQSWKEEEFDTVLQFMRTILLRHGASLVYTTSSQPSQLQTLIHSSLGVTSLLKKQPLKPNVIDRDKVIVPPNWDSWGKIRVLREGFDVEAASSGWAIDLDHKFPPPGRRKAAVSANGAANREPEAPAVLEANGTTECDADGYELLEGSTVALYEQAIRSPTAEALQITGRDAEPTELEVEVTDTQEFLVTQAKVLEAHKAKAEEMHKAAAKKAGTSNARGSEGDGLHQNHVSETIGPLQFNVGGIQVDADDMVKRLQNRQNDDDTPASPKPVMSPTKDTKDLDTGDLQNFFSSLMNRRGASKSAS